MESVLKSPSGQKLLTLCSCYSEGIAFEYDDDCELYAALWWQGIERAPLRWRDRIRWCWRIFRTGLPWTDSVILGEKEAVAIKEFLGDYLKNIAAKRKAESNGRPDKK